MRQFYRRHHVKPGPFKHQAPRRVFDFYVKCIPSVLVDNAGCGAVWVERRYFRPTRNPFDLQSFLKTSCPKCGKPVALSANVGAMAKKAAAKVMDSIGE